MQIEVLLFKWLKIKVKTHFIDVLIQTFAIYASDLWQNRQIEGMCDVNNSL